MSQSAYYRAVERSQRELAGARTPQDAAARAFDVLEPLLAASPDAAARACSGGCAHCCHHPVGVTFAEALVLRDAVRALPAAAREALHANVAAAAAATRDVPWAALGGLRCPLLRDDDHCAVHASRPVACRAWASRDAAACGRSREGIGDVPLDRDAFCAGLGVAAALAAQPPQGHRELRSALAAALAADAPALEHAFAAARPAGD